MVLQKLPAILLSAAILLLGQAIMAQTTYQAESATLSGGAAIASDHSGYTGSGFVGGFTDANKGNAQVQFGVSAASAGNYQLALRFANGTGSGQSLSLYLNGTKLRQTSLGTGANWDSWITATETVSLNSGSNTVAWRYDSTDGGNVNLDSLTVTATVAASNLALGKPVTASGSAGANWAAAYAVDGSTGTYWEGSANAWPSTMTIDLGSAVAVGKATLKLNPAWGSRIQNIAVWGSIDNYSFSSLATAANYTFDPSSGDVVNISLNGGSARYVRVSIANNSGASAGQIAECEVYAGSGGGGTTGSPDLVITSLTWNPTSIVAGNGVAFSAIVKNQGTAATANGVKHGLAFSIDGSVVSWADNYTSSIPAGASVTITANGGPNGALWAASAGSHNLSALIDDVGLIAESNESNNIASASLSVTAAPTLGNGLYRIRNFWQTTAYLYESAGQVKYGTPTASDTSSQWALVDLGTGKALWNAATGNYMTVASVSSNADPVTTAYDDTSAMAQWTVASGSNGGYQTIQSLGHSGWYLTLEGLKGFAQAYSISPSWGSPQWAFEYLGTVPVRPAAKPDLVISDLSWTPVSPVPGSNVSFKATIRNQGLGTTPANTKVGVAFLVDGTKVTWNGSYSSPLASGASITLTADGGTTGATWAMTTGAHSVVAIADDGSLITETDESNNSASKLLTTVAYGASLPYTTIEAESSDMISNGSLITGNRTWGTLTSEASGRAAMQLSAAGQYVEFNLKATAQGLVLRYSIPDTADGSAYNAGLSLYVNGVKKSDISLTNKYSWIYGTWSTEGGNKRWSNNPNATPKNPHRFYDEASVFLDASYPIGTTIKLMRESSNLNFASTPSVTIDFVETEAIPAALTKPANYLDITAYGAQPNDGVDDTAAMSAALSACKTSGGANPGIWIPTGSFDFTAGKVAPGWDGTGTRIYTDGISIRGAGPWYSVLQGNFAGVYALSGNLTMADFRINATDILRDDDAGVTGFEGDFGDSTISNVWVEHAKVGIWCRKAYNGTNIPSGLKVVDSRFRDIWADGLNLNYGVSNSTVSNCNFRNTGDDGMAMWSEAEKLDVGNTFQNNTIQLPGMANGIAIYGGKDNKVLNNLIVDTIDNGAGIQYGTNFKPLSLTGSLTISNNSLVRCGSWHHDYGYGIGAIWGYWIDSANRIASPTITISGNQIQDSSYAGIFIEETSTGATVLHSDNTISVAGTYGVEIRSTANGTASFTNTKVTGAVKGAFINNAANMSVNGSGNSW